MGARAASLLEHARKSNAPGEPSPGKPIAAHALPSEALIRTLASADFGLSENEARERLVRVGPNSLPEADPLSLFAIFARQLKSPLIYLLLAAAALSAVLAEYADAVVILVVVTANACIGAFQESRAEKSMAALRKLTDVHTRVLRSSVERVVSASALVPGDVVIIAAGDAVPADVRILESVAAQASEAALTGESVPVAKQAALLPASTPLAERSNMLHAGTHLIAGRARALVVATGVDTETGKIARLTEKAQSPKTPLERRIEQLGKQLLVGGGVVFVTILALGLLRGLAFDAVLMVGISQLVSVVPEGLPAAMTIALAVGMQRMAKRGAIVRRMAAVESLGSTTVICTDKTGTLTRNEMTVTDAYLPSGRALMVNGVGYAPRGEVSDRGHSVSTAESPELRALCEALVLCNDARLAQTQGELYTSGDPTEIALLTFASKAGVDLEVLRMRVQRTGEVPFDPATKWMATAHGTRVLIKGAPEVVLALCEADGKSATHLEAARTMAAAALRVLAIAVVDDGTGLVASADVAQFRGRATLLGLVGQVDPPREDIASAVTSCARAGIRTVMVTGDHALTGLAIARQIGIAHEQDVALTEQDLAAMNDAELDRALERAAVFARVHPERKLRIVEAFQRRGHVVSMTGDGVNDAPALALADVGIAMGRTGTEVAKQAADVVLTDDDFATIVKAIEQGRIVYRNLAKVVLLVLSTGIAEVLVLLFALACGYTMPFSAVQILWNNVVTEGTITVNLTMEPAEGDELARVPRPVKEPLLTRLMLGRLVLMAVTITAVTLIFYIVRPWYGGGEAQARTATFTLLAMCEWFNVLNCRSETRSAFTFDLIKNHALLLGISLSCVLQACVVYLPALQRIFHTVALPFSEVLLVGAVGSLVLWVEEARKWLANRRAPALAPSV